MVIFMTAGWCTGNTFASRAEGPRFHSRLLQVVQSPSCELVQLRLDALTPWLVGLTSYS